MKGIDRKGGSVMKLSRRSFLAQSAAGIATGLGVPTFAANAVPEISGRASGKQQMQGRLKLAVSTYSYWGFRERKDSIESCILKAADMGIEGVDVLHRQMESEDNSYLQKLKRLAYENGIALVCLCIHQGWVNPDKEYRQRMVDHTIRCIRLAYKMGIPALRLNSGTWGTSGSFDNLMKARGIEKPVEGYTDNDAFGWVEDAIYKCLPVAEECGVTLALENHWGIAGTPEGMLRIKNDVRSNWLKLLVDTGNFLEEPYDKLAQVLPEAIFISAKTYNGGGTWYTLDLDYDRIIKQIYDVGFRGYLTLEFEGKENPDTAVPASIKMLKGYIDKYYTDYIAR